MNTQVQYYLLIRSSVNDTYPWIRGPFNTMAEAQDIAQPDRPWQFIIFAVDEDGKVYNKMVGKHVPLPVPASEFKWLSI
jgi:hypothetical protein